ncbi:MAG: NADPH:quinone reductase [Candidatus Riflebacteria bacterium]|nr:NADPH:quinone reductase [Candidatus Riflebacteria bacterium]
MRAIRVDLFGGPEVMRLKEMPILHPGVGQVLVHLKAVGVNPVETYIRSGSYPMQPALPYTPGMDGAGIIEETGDQVIAFKTGDRVYTAGTITGSYAEYALCNLDQVHPLPAKVSFAQGASIGVPYATAYRALVHRAHAMPGETVLIHGASGGVGLAAVQLARACGLQVWGTAGTERGRKLVMEQGAHRVFDHGAPDYIGQILQDTAGRGIDIILEMLANQNLAKDLTLLSSNGRVVVIGSRGRVEIDPREAMRRDADIRGMVLFNTPPADLARIHAGLFAGLENATLRPVISRELPLADAPQAHIAIMQPGAAGKIILIP